MRSVDDAAVATYPALAVEEERSFLVRVMGWILPFLRILGWRAFGRVWRENPPKV
jgi:hypothetical protein